MNNSNSVIVFPHPCVSGWNGERDLADVHCFPQLEFREVLRRDFDEDSHFVQYTVPNETGPLPRINKSAVAYLGDLDLDVSRVPKLTCVVLDFDAPNHDRYTHDNRAWSDAAAPDGWLDRVFMAFEHLDIFQHAAVWETRGGLKAAWPLNTPIDVRYAESYIEMLIEHVVVHANLEPDDACTDWTRLQRVPFPVREDKEDGTADYTPSGTWHSYEDVRPLDDVWTPSSELKKRTVAEMGDATTESMPAIQNVGKPTKSEFKALSDVDAPLARQLYNGRPLAPEGSRHDAYMSAVAKIAYAEQTNDPSYVFKLVLPSLRATNERDDEKLGYEEVWKECVHVAKKQDGVEKQKQEEQRKIVERTAEQMDVDGSEVPSRIVLTTKSDGVYFVWNERTGEYDAPPAGDLTAMKSLINDRCPALMSRFDLDEKQASKIVEWNGKVIDDVVIDYRTDRTYLSDDERVLHLGTASIREDLDAEYHEDVDTFFRALGGNREAKFLDWMATVPRLDRGSCALYLCGPPNTGKTALAIGIARLWGEQPTEYEDVIGDFQPSLMDCPLVHADESIPEDAFESNASAKFRQLVGNSSHSVEEKYKSPRKLKGNLRVLITANNPDAIPVAETLQQDDVEAVQQRIGYVRTGDDARVFLQRRAAEETGGDVRAFMRRFVEGDAIAEHVLWLAENREVMPDARYMVDGWESELTRRLAVEYGETMEVGTAVVQTIRDRKKTPAVIYGDGEVLLNVEKLREQWSQLTSGLDVRPPELGDAIEAAKLLCASGANIESEPILESDEIADFGYVNRQRFFRLDLDKLSLITELRRLMATPDDLREIIRRNRDAIFPDDAGVVGSE